MRCMWRISPLGYWERQVETLRCSQHVENLFQNEVRKMRQKIKYRQYWLVTLEDRHPYQVCGELAINAQEIVDDYGTCRSVSWLYNQDLLDLAIGEKLA